MSYQVGKTVRLKTGPVGVIIGTKDGVRGIRLYHISLIQSAWPGAAWYAETDIKCLVIQGWVDQPEGKQ